MLEKICNFSEKLFMRYGIRSITMDDVAKELSISKKTIYQYVTDKDDLVKKTMLLHMQELDLLSKDIIENEPNAIIQVLRMAEMVVNNHKEMNPSVLFDLRKYHPETYSFFVEHRENTVFKQLRDNILSGIEQGYYRKNLNIDTTISFYMALMESCASSEISHLNKMSFSEKCYQTVEYHLHAICTEKGINFLCEYLKQSNNTNIQP